MSGRNLIGAGALATGTFVLGLLLGMTLGGPYAIRTPSASEPAATAVPAATTERTAPEAPTPRRTPRADPPVRAADTSPGVDPALAAAIAAVPLPELETGTGVITGTIRTADGAPVPGIEVVARWPDRPEHLEYLDPDKHGIAAWLRRTLEVQMFYDGTTRKSLTRVDGTFRLEGLVDRHYRVGADSDSWDLRLVNQRAQPRPGDTVDFVATPVVTREVRVLGADGQLLVGALVELHRDGRRVRLFTWAKQHPNARVEPGTYDVFAVAGTDSELRSPPQTIAFEAGGDTAPIELTVRGRPGIRGRVKFPDREAPQYAHVRMLPLVGDQPPSDAMLLNGMQAQMRSGDWTFAFDDLAPGRYVVAVARTDDKLAVVREVTVFDSAVEVEIEVPPLKRSEYVAVRLPTADGKEVERPQFSVRVQHKGGMQGGGIGALIPRGANTWWFLLPNYPAEHWVDVKFGLTVTTQSHGGASVEFDPASQAEVVMELSSPAFALVRVQGFATHALRPMLRLSLELIATERHHPSGREHEIGTDGTARLGPSEPGEYDVLLQVTANRRARTIGRTRVTLGSGETSVAVAIPQLYSLTVVANEMALLSRVMLVDSAAGRFARMSFPPQGWDEHGEVKFELLPAGEYEVALVNGPSGSKTVRVPDVTRVEF